MRHCATCGEENPPHARFCLRCGEPLARDSRGTERRKVVSLIFCDVVDSTRLGETSDPEAVRALLARYFDRMQAVVTNHGGTVEKFIGDAVMAVFGVPEAHEDDAQRACRAALAMRDSFAELGLAGRVGVMTGEVVTGTEERLATGDAVNVAARLQQAARPGDVLVGESTVRLVGEAARIVETEPLLLKGKSEPFVAFRLLGMRDVVSEREEWPFVGRERERSHILDAWRVALQNRRCVMITVVGEAGIGKSRLVEAAVSAIDARVVSGRCLPYGEGITYWPVVEIVRQLGVMPSQPAAAQALGDLLGQTASGTSGEEIGWAFRKLLERSGPLVCVFDDIQWGADTLLDLVEQVGLLSSGVALLLICMARSELLERRPQWATSIELGPLTDDQVRDLLGTGVPARQRDLIAEAAGGNPLFASEMRAVVQETKDEISIPATLRALVAARLDQLSAAERSVLECAAVEGEVFHLHAVQALTGDGSASQKIARLVRKGVVRPVEARLADDDGFRFHHLLLRDAAYNGLSKRARAALHERLADWFEGRAGREGEFDEICGYHLDQAHRYADELDIDPARMASVARRAGRLLATAGHRAYNREDRGGALSLLRRASALLDESDPLRARCLLEAAVASYDLADGGATTRELLEATACAARSSGDEVSLVRALIVERDLEWGSEPHRYSSDDIRAFLSDAIRRLEPLRDPAALAHAWAVWGDAAINEYDCAGWADAAHKVIRYSTEANDIRLLCTGISMLGSALKLGPVPLEEGIETLYHYEDGPVSVWRSAAVDDALALLLVMRGDEDKGREHMERASEWHEFDARRWNAGHLAWGWAPFELYAGKPDAAIRYLREAHRRYESLGDPAHGSTVTAELARALLYQSGTETEAEALAGESLRLGAADDVATQVTGRRALALIHARRGDHKTAERLAGEALATIETTDGLPLHADTLLDLADVLRHAGRRKEAEGAATSAAHLYHRKGMEPARRAAERFASSAVPFR